VLAHPTSVCIISVKLVGDNLKNKKEKEQALISISFVSTSI